MKEKTPSTPSLVTEEEYVSSSSHSTDSSASNEQRSSIKKYRQYFDKMAPDITGFLRTLFDFSFDEFITTKLIKVVYGCGVAIGGVLVLFSIIEAFRSAFLVGMLTLIFSPILFLINVIIFRVILELIIVIMHISENLEELTRRQKEQKD